MYLKYSLLLIFVCCSSCATYYQTNYKFNSYFEQGDLEKADQVLAQNKKLEEGKAKLLYYLNRGQIASMEGNYEASNDFFEQAYVLGEDLRNNLLNTAASFLTNPNLTYYTGEDHELLLIHYYKAINYLQLGNHSEALVECRRLNIKLQKLSSKYKAANGKAKYQSDAFVQNLMGIIYEADQDYNNAFIAYRNAVETYRSSYQSLFNVNIPEQLKKDLLRSAYVMGFQEELSQFEQEFGMKYTPEVAKGGNLVFFWNSGLAPVKSEWGINFFLIRGKGGLVNFQNEELGLSFPFYLDSEDDYEKKGLNRVELIRAVFPKYIERPLQFDQARLQTLNNAYELEMAEDVNAIAFQSLQQRMMKEFAVSLMRLALKKAAEYSARDQNQDLGAVVGLINAITEKADTRNWQTIPHSIFYTRVPLEEGDNKVSLEITRHAATGPVQVHDFSFEGKKGKTYFHTYHSLETSPLYNRFEY